MQHNNLLIIKLENITLYTLNNSNVRDSALKNILDLNYVPVHPEGTPEDLG